ncbi:MAG: SDR family NAD(P)-dependent oxidoreductase [Deltaproteobacteria bacterium]|nr:SDR family NAD(P)-dependent oxidoreductase [Deltaproteobacteria bacterium]
MARQEQGLRGKVVVVTGASSGIGRQVCVDLAARGCHVVCAARRARDLEATAALCRNAAPAGAGDLGPLVVPTDVSVEADVRALLDATLSRWGRVDVWVSCAGTTLFSPLADASFAEHRRVIETNLFGAMLSARAVVPLFRRQRRGILIDVGSVLSEIGQPFVPSYAISKFGVRGMAESLRVELADEPDIHVCTVYPYAVDTPHFQTGGNRVGRPARTMPPVQSPEKVSLAIVSLIERPRRELHVPRLAALGVALHRIFPLVTDKLLLHALREFHFGHAEEGGSAGNLFAPKAGEVGTVHGHRRPLIGTGAFFAWLVRELASIQVEAATQPRRRTASPSARTLSPQP